MGILDRMDPLAKFVGDLRRYGLEYSSRRYYGKYMGRVTSNEDERAQGRVKVTCQVATRRSEPLGMWAYPSAPYQGQDKGIYFPPDEGDIVWVWFDHGDTTQPRYSGGMWGNPASVKTQATSHVAAEFKTGDGPVTTRGIKTKRGHGLLFEDSVDKGSRVEMWTGEQSSAGAAATRHHQLVMTDKSGDERVLLSTLSGHKITLTDAVGSRSIEALTKDLLRLVMDDEAKGITLETPLQRKVEILDGGAVIRISDPISSVTLSASGVVIVTTAASNVQSAATDIKTGPLSITAGPTTITAGPTTITAGPTTITTALTNITAGILNVTAAATNLVLAALIISLGAFTVNAAALAQILSPVGVQLGDPSQAFNNLVDARFVALFNAHVHTDPQGGSTGSPTIPMVIGNHTTQKTAAN